MRPPEVFLEERIIPVARGLHPARAQALAEALAAGGITSLEVTMESGTAPEVISALQGTGAVVGAGTVMTAQAAREAVQAGAQFLVSPHLDPLIVEWAVENDVFYLPGVFTPTEAAAAMSLGISTVKLFPAAQLGPGMIEALRGPFPELKVVPTGGISAANAPGFIEAGALAVGVGGWLTGHDDLETITDRALQLRQVV
ncbi:MAG: bifunctional 4-hydroxy-2-oxoglutarate aldolase/2-dehydro-3-deoxy-phosphogluconate aldolase [Actinobacteria bacterium]|mgnify:CR=1 FL=1|nr:MAG: bifunctional 4-hydroxy-2-oxoglutarate aldolase/2-dehydro-3-deoxy-phosphogluconate aldolase [Actinomycetota bacterium]